MASYDYLGSAVACTGRSPIKYIYVVKIGLLIVIFVENRVVLFQTHPSIQMKIQFNHNIHQPS